MEVLGSDLKRQSKYSNRIRIEPVILNFASGFSAPQRLPVGLYWPGPLKSITAAPNVHTTGPVDI